MWKIKEIAFFLEKSAEKFCRFKKNQYLCTRNREKNISFADIGIWCNGNTTDSGPVIPGSSPGIPTIKKFYFKFGIWCNGNTTDSGPVIPGSSPGIPTHMVRHLSVMKGVFFVYRNSVLWSIHNNNPQSFRPGGIVFISSRHQQP